MATLASLVAPRRAHRIAQRYDWCEPFLFEGSNWEIDSPMGSWSYAYDIANTNDSTKNQSCTYAADDLNRLKSANCGSVWSQAFTYDPMGNLTKTASAGMNYLAGYGAHNQVTSGTTFAYDANGNQTLNTVTGLTWNAAGQMVSAGSATATYDALGRMVETVNGSTATEYVYSPQGSQYAVVSRTTLLRGLVPLPGGDTAVYNNSGLNYIRRTDVLGSSRLATTWATHQIYSMESYAPFGEPSDQAGTPDRSFTGQDQDLLPNSTIYDFQFRKQDSTSGRWLSPDPSGWNAVDFTNPQSLNRYAYANNSRLMSVDPLGLQTIIIHSFYCTTGSIGKVVYFDPSTGDPVALAAQGGAGADNKQCYDEYYFLNVPDAPVMFGNWFGAGGGGGGGGGGGVGPAPNNPTISDVRRIALSQPKLNGCARQFYPGAAVNARSAPPAELASQSYLEQLTGSSDPNGTYNKGTILFNANRWQNNSSGAWATVYIHEWGNLLSIQQYGNPFHRPPNYPNFIVDNDSGIAFEYCVYGRTNGGFMN